MAVYDNTYSRIVAWLKVLLPVAALVLLSVMFLIARTIDPTEALRFADVDVDELITDQRITRPSFSGVTEDGAAISFTAEAARPSQDDPEDFSATGLVAQIETPDGARVDIVARDATLDGSQSTLSLSGGVRLTTSTDYVIEGAGLMARLDATWVVTDGRVTALSPAGRIEAGRAELTRQGGEGSESGVYLLVFNDGVKLVYEPKSQQEP